MADDILSSFLVKITYDQDQRSRQKFDEGLKQVQAHATEFGAKIAALPTIVGDATKRISSSLTELYYAGQKNGATARELDALRKAAEQSGEGADRAESSFNAFSQRIRDFATGTAAQYKSLFGVDVDPNHTLDAFIKVREKIEELRNAGGKENLSRANMLARTFGIDEDALVKGRMPIFREWLAKQLKQNEGIAEEKAIALTRAYNALAFALENVARKADSALFDKFGDVLNRLTKWLDDEDAQKRIVTFFTDLATQIGLVFEDLKKLKPAFDLLWEALKETGDWLQKIIGQPNAGGLAGVRHLLELIGGAVMIRFVSSMVAGFAAAFAPLTVLLAALAAIGIVGVGAYAAGEAVSGWLGGGTVGGGFGAGEGTASGGHGSARRARFGHGGTNVGAYSRDGGKGPVAGGETFDKKAPDVMNKLMSKYNLTREQAAGVLGNLGHESAGFSIYHEAGQPEGKGGVGWAQWTGPRRHQFEAWSASHNLDPRSDEASYRYLTEGDPEFSAAIEAVKRQTTVQGSMQAFEAAFERAGVKAYSSRMKYATKALNAKVPIASGAGLDFHKAIENIRSAKPSTPWQQSTSEIHDHRAVTNDVNIHVAGGFPVEKTERPLSRPRNADLIRNTASYAA